MASVTNHAPIVRINLTQHIGRFVGAIREEIASSFEEEIGSPSGEYQFHTSSTNFQFRSANHHVVTTCTLGWTEVPIADIIPKTIAKLGNRVMFGTELGSRTLSILGTEQVANCQS